jgi:hypothetical protein
MCPLHGHSIPEGIVCHIRRSLYGLNQALGFGFSILPLWSQLLVFLLVFMIYYLYSHVTSWYDSSSLRG